MNRIYFAKHLSYLKKIFKGRHILEITKMFNRHFRMKATPATLRTYATTHGLKSGFKPGGNKIYFQKHLDYLKKIVPGRYYSEIIRLFKKRFGFSINENYLCVLICKLGIKTGKRDFPKGHIPWNKGMKGWHAPGCEKGWFKKGQKPKNTMPVGSKRITRDGYIEIKVSGTAKKGCERWKSKHSILWEKANGKIPKGSVVIFADGNNRNFKLSNLLCVTRNELYQLNRCGLISSSGDMTKAAKALVALWIKKRSLKKGTIENSKSKRMKFLDNTGKKIFISHGSGKNRDRWIAVRETKTGLQELRAKSIKARNKFEDAQRDLKEYALLRGWQKA